MNICRKTAAILLVSTFLSCQALDIVRDGKPCAVIAVAPDASAEVRSAAAELQKYLKKISGASLPLVTADKAADSNIICVGESSISRKAAYSPPAFDTSGYDIWIKGGIAVLFGPHFKHDNTPTVLENGLDPHSMMQTPSSRPGNIFASDCGTMHAVSAFLEHLGVRFYAPGDTGTIIPEKKNIRLDDFRKTSKAAFARREYQSYGGKMDEETILWFKHLKSGSARKRTGVLPLANVMRAGEKHHPEWIALDNDMQKIFTNDGCAAPRLLSASLRQAVLREAEKIFDADPQLDELAIMPPALRREHDRRDIRTFRTPGLFPQDTALNIFADFYWNIARELSKTRPGKKIIWHGFHNRNNPKLLPHTRGMNAMMAPWGVTNYADPFMKKSYISQIRRLARQFDTVNMVQREWWNEYASDSGINQGFFFMNVLQDIRKLQSSSVDSLLIDAGIDPASGKPAALPLTHLMYYINSKLLWDPELDMEKLLQEYCRLWFGPAAGEMRKFIDLTEKFCTQKGKRSIDPVKGKFNRENVARIFALLGEAEKNTPENSIYRKRINDIKNSLSGLKSVLDAPAPSGPILRGDIFPVNHRPGDGVNKYRNWITIPADAPGKRTEFAAALREDRKVMFIYLRCYDPEMSKLRKVKRKTDDSKILTDDHIRLDFHTPDKRTCTFAVNAAGSFYDSCSDPELQMRYGGAEEWDPQYSGSAVRYFDDRWEVEAAIGLTGLADLAAPDQPWAINVTRVRHAGGKTEKYSMTAGGSSSWCRLVVSDKDSLGYEAIPGAKSLRPVPGVPHTDAIKVKRARGRVELAGAWEKECWKNVPETVLGWEIWYFGLSSGFRPDTRAKMQYDDKNLYVLFKVDDRYVRGDFKKDQTAVCVDSCVELFIQPAGGKTYFNFECNAIGTLLSYRISPESSRKLTPRELQSVKRFPTLPRSMQGEIETPVSWQLGLQIPLELLTGKNSTSADLSGKVWKANLFKCAEWNSRPHWLLWHKSPAFHRTENFGKVIFE